MHKQYLSMIHHFFILVIFFCISKNTQAQLLVGLKESALGSSGVAISDSSAPSYYNPALLAEKTKNNFSLTGTSFYSLNISDVNGQHNSTQLAPNYLSSIQAFESFIQEFSFANQYSMTFHSTAEINNGTQISDFSQDYYILNYAMAFRNFPFGFSIGSRIKEENVKANSNTNDSSSATGSYINYSQRVAYLFLGFGGLHEFSDRYRFGYKYETRGVEFYNKKNKIGSYYSYDKNSNQFYSGSIENIDDSYNVKKSPQKISIGHSFVVYDHEFLTDSVFVEDEEKYNKFNYSQTFGYKVKFSNKMNFMCGMSHYFEKGINNLSKENIYTSGFAWQTKALQSTLSIYYAESLGSQVTGFTFGSEFVY